MLTFTLRRLNLFIFTIFLLTMLSFSLSFLFPGDQLINISGQINATPEQLVILAEQYKSQTDRQRAALLSKSDITVIIVGLTEVNMISATD